MSEKDWEFNRPTGRIYQRRRARAGRFPLGCIVLVLVLACGCNGGFYLWTKGRCEDRGGHIEFVYGSKDVLWHCVNAERGP